MLVGDVGVVMGEISRSPLQSMLYYLMGFETCFLEHHRNRSDWLALYETLRAKKIEECTAAADGESEFIRCTDNIDGRMTSPSFFKDYCVPFYQEAAEILHAKGKKLVVHMDGSLAPIAELIPRCNIDVIEGFSPPPMGDVPLGVALRKWSSPTVWLNLPGTALCAGRAETAAFMKDLLLQAHDSRRILVGVAENFPIPEGLVGMSVVADAVNRDADAAWTHQRQAVIHPARPQHQLKENSNHG
jgi:hypothetical protein